MRLGLIGFPVSHSWSPRLFARFAERDGITVRYDLFPMPDVSVLRTFLLTNPDIVGLNVTIPHKTAVLSLCDALHPSASRIGAVNTLLIRRNGRYGGGMHITGYNTDVGGFASALVRAMTEVDSELAAAVMAARGPAAAVPAAAVPAAPGPAARWSAARGSARIFKHRRALILGSGGSARAVAWALRDLGIAFDQLVRATPEAVDRPDIPHALAEASVLQRSSPQIQDAFARARRFTYDALGSVPWEDYDLLVHCTPLGMDPGFAGQRPPIDLSHCRASTLLFDLVYTPEITPLMQYALDCGLHVCGGIGMLEHQAEEAWSIWKSATDAENDMNESPISSS
ncbi:MAG: shikimate dehydrogenase [Bacteroidetes bacterium]|nr:shikimate dehydrogenase [Bacteroidota bacterium]